LGVRNPFAGQTILLVFSHTHTHTNNIVSHMYMSNKFVLDIQGIQARTYYHKQITYVVLLLTMVVLCPILGIPREKEKTYAYNAIPSNRVAT
jgi:hypothetical protein